MTRRDRKSRSPRRRCPAGEFPIRNPAPGAPVGTAGAACRLVLFFFSHGKEAMMVRHARLSFGDFEDGGAIRRERRQAKLLIDDWDAFVEDELSRRDERRRRRRGARRRRGREAEEFEERDSS